ncbi:MAG: TIGR00645 family protein [Defluviicoccus sp.]|nr:TIGR00645 family protein [Defluviicoccus sp.]MDG4593183.1 TIGR00645 family protein [Defluviicoccus sp.]MDS4012056.1 TIGR00645 family protein [Defluviicoccus sp.]
MLERPIERLIFASRWIMAPFYLGLAATLVLLLVKFALHLIEAVPALLGMSDSDLILVILSLIDLCLVGNLLIIVMFSGYENFVSKLDAREHPDWPEWISKIDFGGLKLKLVASIVAISAITLLKSFMDVNKVTPEQLKWQVIVHLTFVVSGVLLALMDWLADRSHTGEGH